MMIKFNLDIDLATGLRHIYQHNWPSFCDLTLICADGETVLVPKLVLAIHSKYFSTLFKHEPTIILIFVGPDKHARTNGRFFDRTE